MNRIELIRTDGSERRTIELPFSALATDTLAILPGAKDLIVVERPSSAANHGVYLVNAATNAVNKLFDYSPQGRLPEISVSPDGRTVLALITEIPPPSVSAMDFSTIR
jgi:hypothetical protein